MIYGFKVRSPIKTSNYCKHVLFLNSDALLKPAIFITQQKRKDAFFLLFVQIVKRTSTSVQFIPTTEFSLN